MVLLFVPGMVRADGMVISKPMKIISETGQRAVIWHEGGTETLILSTSFKGDPEEFAWIIPVPARPDVSAGKDELFTALDDYVRPRYDDRVAVPLMGISGLSVRDSYTPSVNVLQTKKVDIYDIAVLEANDAGALSKWLTDNGYEYPANRDLLLKHYINKKWFFVAAKVSAEAVGYTGSSLATGHATPLSITFASEHIVYPLKISGLGSKYNEAEKVAAFGFETGFQGWNGNGGVVTGGESKQGEKSLRLAVPAVPTPRLASQGTVRTNYDQSVNRSVVGIKRGIQYVYSAYLKSGSGSGKVQLKAQIGTMREETEEIELASLKNWTRVDLPFKPFSDGSVVLSMVIPQGQEGQTVYIDAVQLEAGKEPSEFTSEIEPSSVVAAVDESVSVVLYVFSGHKQYLPGFSTEYAGDVPAKDIARMAVNEDGDPWREPKKSMYLTKLTRRMRLSEMTDDLIIRDAPDNQAVGGVNRVAGGAWRPVLVFGLLAGVELFTLGYYWYSKSRKKV